MRVLLLTALLASAAAPALAAPHDRDRGSERQSRADRDSSRSDRAERRADRADRQADRSERRADRQERRVERVERVEREDARPAREVREVRRIERVERASRGADNDTVRNWRPQGERAVTPRVIERARVHESVQDRTPNRVERRAERRVIRDREDLARSPATADNRIPRVSRVPIEGTQPPLRTTTASRDRDRDRDGHRWRRDGDRDGRHWRRDWRDDHRYDWRRWRDRHRSTFRIGLYFDPFGWNYRRYDIGWRLWPSYYSSRYWINDPWMYRLPYAPPGYRWIRYYNDAILIDSWTGQVEDVIYNFFW